MQKDEQLLASLSQRLGALSVGATHKKPGKLQGVPTPAGKHTRFADDGSKTEEPAGAAQETAAPATPHA